MTQRLTLQRETLRRLEDTEVLTVQAGATLTACASFATCAAGTCVTLTTIRTSITNGGTTRTDGGNGGGNGA